jgi:polyisoprenoid-binding protein YceI
MKRIATVVALAAALAAPAFAAETWVVDPGHSEVSFQVRHLMSRVRGVFRDFSATIVRDADPAKSSVEFTIQATSIDTGIADRDKHLRTADFFDVDNHPTITFKSTSIEKVSDAEYKVTGPLTMRGVTKVITLPVTFDGEMKDPWGNLRAGFSTETTVNRKEFGINWNKALDQGGFLLSDDVEVEIHLSTRKP